MDVCLSVESKSTAYVKGLVEGADVNVLMDPGSNVSLISEEFRMSLPALRKRVLSVRYTFARTVNGQLFDTLGTVTLPIWLGEGYWEQTVHVVWGATQAILLGSILCYRLKLLWTLVVVGSALGTSMFLSCRPQASCQNVVTQLCPLLLLSHLSVK